MNNLQTGRIDRAGVVQTIREAKKRCGAGGVVVKARRYRGTSRCNAFML
jgi:hypothetical protein